MTDHQMCDISFLLEQAIPKLEKAIGLCGTTMGHYSTIRQNVIDAYRGALTAASMIDILIKQNQNKENHNDQQT